MGFIEERNIKGGKSSPKIMGGYGLRNYYKFYKQKGGSVDGPSFARLTREMNKIVAEEMIEYAESYVLPYGLGSLDFRKRKNVAFMTDKGIRSSSAVDWKKTTELWEKDPQARRNKVRVKYANMHTARYTFKLKCFARKFKNREYFAFVYKRSFKRAFAERVNTYEKPKIDAFIEKTI